MRTVNVSSAKRSLQRRKITASPSATRLSAFVQADFGPRVPTGGVDVGDRRLVGRDAASGQKRGRHGRDMPCRAFHRAIGLIAFRRYCAFAAASVAVIGRPGRFRPPLCFRFRFRFLGGGCGLLRLRFPPSRAASVVFTGFAAVVRTLAVASRSDALLRCLRLRGRSLRARLPVGTAGLSFTRLAGPPAVTPAASVRSALRGVPARRAPLLLRPPRLRRLALSKR